MPGSWDGASFDGMHATTLGSAAGSTRGSYGLRPWICSLSASLLLLLTAHPGSADPPPASAAASTAAPRFHLFSTSPLPTSRTLSAVRELETADPPLQDWEASSSATPSAHRIREALRADGAEIRAAGKFLALRPWGDLKRHPWAGAAIAGTLFYASSHKRGLRDEFLEDDPFAHEAGLLDASSKFGEWQIPAAATVGLYLGGLASNKPAVREGGLLLAETMLYTAVVTGIGQSLFAEDRPQEGGKLHLARAPGHGVSGHASFSVALTQPLVRRYLGIRPDDGPWLRAGKRAGQVVGWSIPLLTGLSRIQDDKHFLWNVLAGWGVGYYVSDTVWKAHRRRLTGEPVRHGKLVPSTFAPWVGPESSAGFIVAWHF